VPDFQSAASVQGRPQEEAMNTSKTNIIYARLSVDDGEDKISNSIQNQFALLTDYAERNGFTPYLTLQDDGYSGSNFDRPGWQELIARVEAGEVGTLLLKDASRMGRSYLQCGLYREMFASKGVRLICVNDGTDTLFGDDDLTPFREIWRNGMSAIAAAR
jgi:DNA invertase Pin-like site-specific DNA recombinase